MSPRPSVRRFVAMCALAGTAITGCGDDGPPARDDAGIAPTFAPETSTTAGDGETGASPTSTPSGATPPSDLPGSTPSTIATTEAAIADPDGDASPSPVDPAPAWADLLGARLTRSEAGFELRIRLAGGHAPEGSGSSDHTMNVASFYDVDGDGAIDFQVWANLADGGWEGSYFDDEGGGRFGEESFVDVSTEGDEVVLRFALRHLDQAERFRWSVASEWGRYTAIGTPAMVRDEAPDDDGSALFPGA